MSDAEANRFGVVELTALLLAAVLQLAAVFTMLDDFNQTSVTPVSVVSSR